MAEFFSTQVVPSWSGGLHVILDCDEVEQLMTQATCRSHDVPLEYEYQLGTGHNWRLRDDDLPGVEIVRNVLARLNDFSERAGTNVRVDRAKRPPNKGPAE
jgi:hypothetical protein